MRDELVSENIKLVHFALNKCFKMRPSFRDYEDCFQEGCVGLIKAAECFDENKGIKFSTYATYKIIGEIRRYKRDYNLVKTSRIPQEIYNKLKRLDMLDATLNQITDMFGCSVETAEKALLCNFHVISGDKLLPTSDNKNAVAFDLIPGKADDLSAIDVGLFLDQVSIRDRRVIEMAMNGRVQTEISNSIGIAQASVSRILKRLGIEYLTYCS